MNKSKKPLVLLRSQKLIENEIKALDEELAELLKKANGRREAFASDAKRIKARKTFLLNVIEYYNRFGFDEEFMLRSLKSAYVVLKFELSVISESENYLNLVYDEFIAKNMIKDMKAAYHIKDKREQIKVIEFIDEGRTIRNSDFKKASKIEITQIEIQ